MRLKLWIAAGSLSLALTGPGVASVDTTAGPGGVYRLKPGIYVRKDVACELASSSAVRRYDGRSIGDVDARACRVRIMSRHGSRYAVAQSCIHPGGHPRVRVTERQTVTVSDALTFTLSTRGHRATYGYCPSYMLPAGLRGTGK